MSEEPKLPQRALAQKMGVSLGKVNYVLGELTAKGWIKIKRFKNSQKKIAYAYILTPRGLEQKTILAIGFLKRKREEYEVIKREIGELYHELEDELSRIRDSDLQ